MRRLLAVAVVAACGHPAPAPVVATPHAAPPDAGLAADAPPAGQEEQLAAIQKAMNELDEVAQACWAAVAVERFDIEGNLEARITIPGQVEIVTDTTRTPKLAACMTQVLATYPWAPPLRGQTIQLPFRFRAPDGQSVIDRRLVPSVAQGGVAVSVLLDDANTGNEAASMFELAIAGGGSTGMRAASRAELWFFLAPATVGGVALAAGDMMFVPAGGARDVAAPAEGTRAMIVMTPGGREGSARAGALPTRGVSAAKQPGPVLLRASAAKRFGDDRAAVTIFGEPATTKSPSLSASLLELPAGFTVGEHVHAKETELLYVLAGSGTLTVNGVALPVSPTSVVQVPAGAKHAFAVTAAFRAVQIFTPAGPEQRAKSAP